MLRRIVLKFRETQNCLLSMQNNLILHRNCSKLQQENYLGVSYEPNFTDAQKIHVLEIINNSTYEDLSRFNLSKNRIKKIDAWKKKNGVFNNLTEVLDVDGLSVKMLHRLCTSIIEASNQKSTHCLEEKPFKTRGQILTPSLSSTKINDLQSAVGIHLFSTGLSWAKLEKSSNYLTDWNYINYNATGKKMSLTDALQIVLEVCKELPPSDIYVFETPVSVSPTAQQSAVSVTAYTQKVQILSMLMAVLSISPRHNPANIASTAENHQNTSDLEPNVFFLRQRLPARLFQTLIGNERVSAAMVVQRIINNEKPDKGMQYSPIAIDNQLSTNYDTEMPVNKEILGQALLLTMAFMDVCVYQNVRSIRAISNSRY